MATYIILMAATSAGCVGTRLDRVVAAMGKDPATVHVKISSVYGVVELARTNPRADSLAHVVGPDGTITIKEPAVRYVTNYVTLINTNAPAR